MKKAVILLSGGLDSSTTLYYAKSKGYSCHCLIFDYGQRHKREIKSAKGIAKKANCESQVVKIQLPHKGSSLLDNSIAIPKNRDAARFKKGIPSTYVPGRNIIFLSFAVSYAEAIGAGAIFIGANAIDYSGYPDCRPEFFEAFKKVINTGTKVGSKRPSRGSRLEVKAPLILKSKADIVRLARRLKVPIELTWSCYKGGETPCRVCDSCILRAKGFKDAGLVDKYNG